MGGGNKPVKRFIVGEIRVKRVKRVNYRVAIITLD